MDNRNEWRSWPSSQQEGAILATERNKPFKIEGANRVLCPSKQAIINELAWNESSSTEGDTNIIKRNIYGINYNYIEYETKKRNIWKRI